MKGRLEHASDEYDAPVSVSLRIENYSEGESRWVEQTALYDTAGAKNPVRIP